METSDFKRDAYKTLNPKVFKAAQKALLGKSKTVNLASSVMGCGVAASRLLHDFQGYMLGFQMNDVMRSKATDDLGELLQHSTAVAKICRAKVPGAGKKVKSKNTMTWLLTEISRVTGDMLATLNDVAATAKTVPMTPEEKATAEARIAKSAEKAKAKPPKEPKKDAAGNSIPPKPKTAPTFEKVQAGALDEAKLGQQATHLLGTILEFVASAYKDAEGHPETLRRFMQHRIDQLTPNYPKGFFDPPPPKPGPVKKVKKEGAATPAPTAAPA